MIDADLFTLPFDNSFVRAMPADPETRNARRQVFRAGYSRVKPTPVAAPRLVGWAREVADLVGLPPEPDPAQREALAQILTGNRLVEGMDPVAACYGGHQFGHWAGQLGDGRAITLGEVNGGRGRWELQLKGAGPTPYSRRADGRAVLRSSVREFLCSEAMHHLGVPTTRALSLARTGEAVVRDMFYDGNARPEPGAIVCRVAPSFVRFGNFQILAERQDKETLRTLADYVVTTHFPHLGAPDPEVYAAWLTEIAERTAEMVTHWMRVGFVHGVMNTDNMSILGLTIDYGPYGWLEPFDPGWTPNTTDAQGRRYRFGAQPAVAGWNLARLAESLHPLIGSIEPLQAAVDHYAKTLDDAARRMMAGKLGISERMDGAIDANADLVSDLWAVMQGAETDMTLFFRGLADVPTAADVDDRTDAIAQAWYAEPSAEVHKAMNAWLDRWAARAREDGRPDAERAAAMNRVNPLYVMRNYLAQQAIDAAEAGDDSEITALLDAMRRPYDAQPGMERFAGRRPEWARHRPGCSMLSCSS